MLLSKKLVRRLRWQTLCNRSDQQVDRDRPVDRRVSVGRSRLILHWIDKMPQITFFNQYSSKYCHDIVKCQINQNMKVRLSMANVC